MKNVLLILIALISTIRLHAQEKVDYVGEVEISNAGDLTIDDDHYVSQICRVDNELYVVSPTYYYIKTRNVIIYHYDENLNLLNTKTVPLSKKKGFAFDSFQVIDEELYMITRETDGDKTKIKTYSVDLENLNVGEIVDEVLEYEILDIETNVKSFYLTSNEFRNGSKNFFRHEDFFYFQSNTLNQNGEYTNEISIYDTNFRLVQSYDDRLFPKTKIVNRVKYTKSNKLIGMLESPLQIKNSKGKKAKLHDFDATFFTIIDGTYQEIKIGISRYKVDFLNVLELENGNYKIVGVTQNLDGEMEFVDILIDKDELEVISSKNKSCDMAELMYSPTDGYEKSEINSMQNGLKNANYLVGNIHTLKNGNSYFVVEQFFNSSLADNYGNLMIIYLDKDGEFMETVYIKKYFTKLTSHESNSNLGYYISQMSDNSIGVFVKNSSFAGAKYFQIDSDFDLTEYKINYTESEPKYADFYFPAYWIRPYDAICDFVKNVLY